MSIARFIFPLLVVSMFVFAPQVTLAANANFFGPIISDGTNGQPNCQCSVSAPDWGCALQTVQNTINVGVSLGVIFTVLVIAYAGYLFMFSAFQSRSREQARTILLHAVLGLAIALSAWLLVDFVMKTLYKEDSQFGPWNTILSGGNYCLSVHDVPAGTPNANPSAGTGNGTGSSTTGRSSITDSQARTQLSSAHYSFSSTGNCTEDRSNCTYLGGIQQSALSTLVSLGNKSGCSGMTITGGSEPGHAGGPNSHGNGYKIDIRNNATANSCIEAHTTRYPAGDRGGDGGGTARKDSCGNVYVQESDHWDVQFTAACSF